MPTITGFNAMPGTAGRIYHTRRVVSRADVIQLDSVSFTLVDDAPQEHIPSLVAVVLTKPAGTTPYTISADNTIFIGQGMNASHRMTGITTSRIRAVGRRRELLYPYSAASGSTTSSSVRGVHQSPIVVYLGGSNALSGGDDQQPFIFDVFYDWVRLRA